MITKTIEGGKNPINKEKEIKKEIQKEKPKEEKSMKEITIDITKRNINTYTIPRKNSDSTRNLSSNTIPAERERHFTRKVEKTNRMEIDSGKKDVPGDKTIIANSRGNYEGTFKNSIRNKYKRIRMEKNG